MSFIDNIFKGVGSVISGVTNGVSKLLQGDLVGAAGSAIGGVTGAIGGLLGQSPQGPGGGGDDSALGQLARARQTFDSMGSQLNPQQRNTLASLFNQPIQDEAKAAEVMRLVASYLGQNANIGAGMGGMGGGMPYQGGGVRF